MKAALFALFLLPAVAMAESTYDPQTGNFYTTTPTYGGGARINGFNSSTGSTWNTTVQPNGNMNGMDSNGNMWNYNRSSGSYMNSNGHGCMGHGALRTCW